MQFRFRTFDEDNNAYKLITIINIEDYDVMFKVFTFMAEHKCEYSIELNSENMVEKLGDSYEVENVALCVSKDWGDDGLTPYFVVDLKEC